MAGAALATTAVAAAAVAIAAVIVRKSLLLLLWLLLGLLLRSLLLCVAVVPVLDHGKGVCADPKRGDAILGVGGPGPPRETVSIS